MNETTKYKIYGKQVFDSEWQWITEEYSFKSAADLCDEMVNMDNWYNAGVKDDREWVYTTGDTDGQIH